MLKKISIIYMEMSLVEIYLGAPLYEEVRTWMKEKGFEVKKEYLEWEDMGNILFIKSR